MIALLLLITGSADVTSDLICKKLGNEVFRFNYDIFQDYALEFTTNNWQITNPFGLTISSATVTSCFWWKAFNFQLENQDNFVIEEVKYIFRELYNWCRLRGVVKGNPHDFHNHFGKINLLEVASKYFITPKTLATFKCAGVDKLGSTPVVAKSFTSALTDNMGSLLTTEVDKSRLHPGFPWYLQERIDSDFDVTVFVCGNKLFAYERSRKELKGLDWRAEQDFEPGKKEWVRFTLSDKDKVAVEAFCKDIGVNWGRLDLMTTADSLAFLEYNANGQWMFLDYSNEDGVLDTVIDYITA